MDGNVINKVCITAPNALASWLCPLHPALQIFCKILLTHEHHLHTWALL